MISKKQYINYLIFLFISVVLLCPSFYYLPTIVTYIASLGPIFIPHIIGVFAVLFVVVITTIMISKTKSLNDEIVIFERKIDKKSRYKFLIIEGIISAIIVAFLFVLYFVIVPLIAENKDIMNYNEFLRLVIGNTKQDWCLLIANTLIFIPTIIIDRCLLLSDVKKEKKALFWMNYIVIFALCTSCITYFVAGFINTFSALVVHASLINVGDDLYIYFSLLGYIAYFLIKFNFLEKAR